jgi:hypothetical protein
VRDPAQTEHALQLSDSRESTAAALAEFVKDGVARDEQILLVIRLDDWNRAAVTLGPDLSLSEAVSSGQLTVCDSSTMLNAILEDGIPSTKRFEQTIGTLVAQSAARRNGLRAYGDMVDLLAAEGRFDAAEQLEELWNDLRKRIPFMLLCGYSSSHFGRADNAPALRRLCHLHTRNTCAAGDFLANELMEAGARG